MEREKIGGMMIKRLLLLILVVAVSGCTIAWQKELTVGAKGAKTKAYGNLDSGDLIYKSNWYIGMWGKDENFRCQTGKW